MVENQNIPEHESIGNIDTWIQSQYTFARLFLETVCITLPLLPLTFPFFWIIANYSALAQILATFCSMRHVKITEDPFDGDPNLDSNQSPNVGYQYAYLMGWKLNNASTGEERGIIINISDTSKVIQHEPDSPRAPTFTFWEVEKNLYFRGKSKGVGAKN